MITNIKYYRRNYLCPNAPLYVKVINAVPSLAIVFVLQYIDDGQSITKTSRTFLYQKNARLYFNRSTISRSLIIYKDTGLKKIFLFHTGNIPDANVCFEVQGIPEHPITQCVPC